MIRYVPENGDDKAHFIVETPGGTQLRLGATDPFLQQMGQQLASEILEGKIDEAQALLPANIAGRFIDLLREKGLKFDGTTMDEAWEGLIAIMNKMNEAQRIITQMKGQAVAQRTLDAIAQNLNVSAIGWWGLNPGLRESISTMFQAITVAALQQGELINDGTVETAEKIKQIDEKLKARRSSIEHLIGRAAEGLGNAIGSAGEGLGSAADGILTGAATHIEEIPTAAGKGLGGLLGDGARSALDKTSSRKRKDRVG